MMALKRFVDRLCSNVESAAASFSSLMAVGKKLPVRAGRGRALSRWRCGPTGPPGDLTALLGAHTHRCCPSALSVVRL